MKNNLDVIHNRLFSCLGSLGLSYLFKAKVKFYDERVLSCHCLRLDYICVLPLPPLLRAVSSTDRPLKRAGRARQSIGRSPPPFVA